MSLTGFLSSLRPVLTSGPPPTPARCLVADGGVSLPGSPQQRGSPVLGQGRPGSAGAQPPCGPAGEAVARVLLSSRSALWSRLDRPDRQSLRLACSTGAQQSFHLIRAVHAPDAECLESMHDRQARPEVVVFGEGFGQRGLARCLERRGEQLGGVAEAAWLQAEGDVEPALGLLRRGLPGLRKLTFVDALSPDRFGVHRSRAMRGLQLLAGEGEGCGALAEVHVAQNPRHRDGHVGFQLLLAAPWPRARASCPSLRSLRLDAFALPAAHAQELLGWFPCLERLEVAALAPRSGREAREPRAAEPAEPAAPRLRALVVHSLRLGALDSCAGDWLAWDELLRAAPALETVCIAAPLRTDADGGAFSVSWNLLEHPGSAAPGEDMLATQRRVFDGLLSRLHPASACACPLAPPGSQLACLADARDLRPAPCAPAASRVQQLDVLVSQDCETAPAQHGADAFAAYWGSFARAEHLRVTLVPRDLGGAERQAGYVAALLAALPALRSVSAALDPRPAPGLSAYLADVVEDTARGLLEKALALEARARPGGLLWQVIV